MLKKFSGILVITAIVAGCDNTAPVGGQGYFDAPMPQPVVIEEIPVDLVPSVETDLTDPLSTAVEEALVATQTPPVPEAAVPAIDPATISTDDGTLDLNITSLDQQIIERNEAARILEAARSQLVIIEPGTLPDVVAGVNIAEYARSTTNELGDRNYRRPVFKARFSNAECRKFTSPDDAQRYFLANGGPKEDPLNLDPDGDGFACKWSPEYYRLLR